jgi:hypothetical protein
MTTNSGQSAEPRSQKIGPRWRRAFPSAIVLAALGATILSLTGGCEVARTLTDPVLIGPFFEVKNFTGVARLPATLRRVVLLPVAGVPGVPVETLASFDPVMLAELQRVARFEVVVADPAALERLCDHQRLLSSDTLPAQFLALVCREYGADAVMFVDVTASSAYQPLVLGLRAKLASTDGTMLWSFDTLFAAGEPPVANSARRHDRQRHPVTDPGDMSYTVLRSPARFADYAAAAAFATLPPR